MSLYEFVVFGIFLVLAIWAGTFVLQFVFAIVALIIAGIIALFEKLMG